MIITQELCLSFQQELLLGLHNINIHEFYFALIYNEDKNFISKYTKSYYEIEEIELINEGNYNKGGNKVEKIELYSKDDILLLHFNDINWNNATFETTGGIMYNNSLPNKNSVAVFKFEESLSVDFGTFSLFLEKPSKTFKKIL